LDFTKSTIEFAVSDALHRIPLLDARQIFILKQPSSASMTCSVLARKCAGRPVIGARALGAMGLPPRRFDDNLRRIGSRRAPGRAAEYSGSSDRSLGRISCKIARKEAIGGKVAVIVAAVIIPTAGVAKAQCAAPEVLRKGRCCGYERKRCRAYQQNSRFDHCDATNRQLYQGRIVPQSPFQATSRPLRNCR
jgi:hypothetical protein